MYMVIAIVHQTPVFGDATCTCMVIAIVHQFYFATLLCTCIFLLCYVYDHKLMPSWKSIRTNQQGGMTNNKNPSIATTLNVNSH